MGRCTALPGGHNSRHCVECRTRHQEAQNVDQLARLLQPIYAREQVAWAYTRGDVGASTSNGGQHPQ